jgi:hypothetical protein
MTVIPTSTTDLANMPIPAGATCVSEWDASADPDAGRYFSGTKRVIDRTDDPYNPDLMVEIYGEQTREGEVSRYIDVLNEERRQQLSFRSAAHARAFGEALIAAADEIEGWAAK